MKKLLMLVVLFVLNKTAFSQAISADSLAIRATLTNFFEVFTNPDMKHYNENCTSAFQLLENGEVWQKKEIENYVNSALSKPKVNIRTNKFDFISLNIRGDIAWLNYHNTATLTNIEKNTVREIRWLESAVFEKQNSRWFISQLHSTVVGK